MQKGQYDSINKEVSLKEVVFKIKDWFDYLCSKWLILLISLVLGVSLGYFFVNLKSVTFTATTTFVIEGNEQSGGLGQYAGVASMMGIDMRGNGGGLFHGDNLLELYKSHKMIELALMRQSTNDSSKAIFDQYIEYQNLQDLWKQSNPNLLEIDFKLKKQPNLYKQRLRDSIIGTVVNDVKRNILKFDNLDKNKSIVKIDVVSVNEVFAKEFNEALVKVVNNFYIETKTKKTMDNISILQQKTDSVKSVMNSAISTAAITLDNTPNLNPTRQSIRAVPSQRSQFSVETNKSVLEQLTQNLELAKMSMMKESPLIQIVDEPIYPLQKNGISFVKYLGLFGFLVTFFVAIFLIVRREFLNLIS